MIEIKISVSLYNIFFLKIQKSLVKFIHLFNWFKK